jgi:ubiquinol-cytochrome c reductase iron-sulfur subunit
VAGEDKVDEEKREFLRTVTSIVAGLGVVAASVPFISSLNPSAKALAAGGPVQVDISQMQPGELKIVEWQGKPVWIVRRTQQMQDHIDDDIKLLRDPDSLVEQQPAYARNHFRSINPEYLVLIGICTHLGCAPTYRPDLGGLGADWPGGFYCPCHGSKFDLAGRVLKGVPAPINLEVPPYRFLDPHTIEIGIDAGQSS